MRTATAAVAAVLVLAGSALAQGQRKEKKEAPRWLSDDGKDVFNDYTQEEKMLDKRHCENAEKLLTHTMGKGDEGASQIRVSVMATMGICLLKKGKFGDAKKRFDMSIGEMGLPSEDALYQHTAVAPIGLYRDAAKFMIQHEMTQAGTALRRCREVINRNLVKTLKAVRKQIPADKAPPLDMMVEELTGYGRTGKILPTLVEQMSGGDNNFKQDLAWAEFTDLTLDDWDRMVIAADAAQKKKRERLAVSKGKSTGQLHYARALPMEATVAIERFAVVKELQDAGITEALTEEAAETDKTVTLVKRTMDGPGCKAGKGFDKTCKALKKAADIMSNCFGDTKVYVVKAEKEEALPLCTTNANVGVVIAVEDGAKILLPSNEEKVDLEAGVPMVIDFCQQVTLEAADTVPVLFAMAWHPEFAAVERTTELRARKEAFKLKEDDVKTAADLVNSYAKKNFDKNAKTWRDDSPMIEIIRNSLKASEDKETAKKTAKAEAKKAEELDTDEKKEKAAKELEEKRAKKAAAAEEAKKKREAAKAQMEKDRQNKDPWLAFQEVKDEEAKLEELKGERREANAKLEFDLTSALTKEISTQERLVKRTIKKAKKAHKKGLTSIPIVEEKAEAEEKEEEPAEEEKKEEKKGKDDLKTLQKKLEDVKEKKKKASEDEDFEAAKKLKKEQKDLEDKIKKLEL